ncbi:uncharacterized protein N7483_006517 [Penicillium malachiteum]|uniref:uncharacterized protein n=1 Tax=Penicillium malachiteum TaxID=1324776 RepID=UPI002548320F|nr:uncharacterized protein N7483_006517 [Penicillium malachiteum]KAJ5725160.1 hypothetical protein N7483_006517 [Penicillium malachiteum]
MDSSNDSSIPSTPSPIMSLKELGEVLTEPPSQVSSFVAQVPSSTVPSSPHGGYAATLIGGRRMTEDVDVIVGKKCFETLLRLPGFSKSTDNRLIFHAGRHAVLIGLMYEQDSRYPLPKSNCSRRLKIQLHDHPDRKIHHSIEILHPSALLLRKLIPWHEAFYATRAHARLRAMTDLEDIETILIWLVRRNQTIDLNYPPRHSDWFRRILGDLYVELVSDARLMMYTNTNTLYYLPSPTMPGQRNPTEFNALDAAATAVSPLLREAHMPYVFQGAYAITLIGGDRLTECIDVIVKHDCFNLLLKHPDFRVSTNNRLIFRYGQTNILINIETDKDTIDDYRPCANTTKRLRIGVRAHPHRRVGTMIDIVDPKILLLKKLLAWHKICIKNREGADLPLDGDFEDIQTILTWLKERDERIDDRYFRFPNTDTEDEFVFSLGDLYVAKRQVRPNLAAILSSHLMRLALERVDA